MSLTASEVGALTRTIERWELAEYLFAGLVTIACFGEYIADFTTWWIKGGLWKRLGPLEKRKETLGKLSTLVLVSALALELVCLVKTNQLSGLVVGSLSERSEEAYNKSGHALTQAGSALQKSLTATEKSTEATTAASSAVTVAREARKEADSFEKDIKEAKRDASEAKALLAEVRQLAAEAQQRASSAEKGTARLTDRLADRVLTDAQVKSISDAVRPFAGQEFDVTPYWDITESLAIANRIAGALVAGGWKYVAPEKSGFMLGGIPGVQVWTHPTADDKVKRAALSLLMVLNREGIESVAKTQNSANPPDSKLHLIVGSKP